jgi:hypothetical protein
VKVGDWIQNRKRPDEVYQVEGIEIFIDEDYLKNAETPMALRALLAAVPLVMLTAPTESLYPSGFTQRPSDFKVISAQEMEEVKASWRTRS